MTAATRVRDDDGYLDSLRRGLLIGAAIAALLTPTAGLIRQAAPAPSPSPLAAQLPEAIPLVADFRGEAASSDARRVVDWIAATRNNGNLDFVIVDKRNAKVFVFDASAKLRGATPVLLGAMPGDDSVEGIGSRPIADVKPEERTTPAGRFLGERGRNAIGEDVVWVDYGAAVSMHRVRTTNASERRLERLATPGIDDNRISYGCINVPVAFYESMIRPTFAQQRAPVYVLPEVKTVEAVFGV